MSSVATITIGTDSYSVYGTQAEVATYLNGRLGTAAFTAATATEKQQAHVQATRWVDTMKWQGVPTDLVTPQPLSWPRTGMVDCDGTVVATTAVPDELCEAVAELVLIILGDNAASDASSTAKNIKALGAGSATVEFFRSGDAQGGGGTPLPTPAWRLIKCFTGAGSQANSGAIASGADQCSQFDDDDRYDLRSDAGFA